MGVPAGSVYVLVTGLGGGGGLTGAGGVVASATGWGATRSADGAEAAAGDAAVDGGPTATGDGAGAGVGAAAGAGAGAWVVAGAVFEAVLEFLEPHAQSQIRVVTEMAESFKSFIRDSDGPLRAAVQLLRLTDESVSECEPDHVACVMKIQFLHDAAAMRFDRVDT